MFKLKFILFTFSLVIFLLVNNSCSVYKKKYSKGYTVSWHKNTYLKSKSSIDTNTYQNTNTEHTTDLESTRRNNINLQKEKQDTENTKNNTSEFERIDKVAIDEIFTLEIEDVQHQEPDLINEQLESEPEIIESKKVNKAAIVALVCTVSLQILTIISFLVVLTLPQLWIFLAIFSILFIISHISVYKAFIQIKKQPNIYSKFNRKIAILALVLLTLTSVYILVLIVTFALILALVFTLSSSLGLALITLVSGLLLILLLILLSLIGPIILSKT